MKNAHVNIPVFIPHLGCPNMCVFCNQHAISGVCSFIPDQAKNTIEAVLASVEPDDTNCEIAFFGGSFTGIDRALMITLLDLAEEYVRMGKVTGIRMSTRPDYISEEIIGILKNYTVAAVELGIQSFSDHVLERCCRGHSAEDSGRAMTMLREAGIAVVGQMMIGLPGSLREDEIHTAESIVHFGASGARIYPTLVFRDTELHSMMRRGSYTPLTVDEAAERSADALDIFVKSGVNCLRIGLCDSENLHTEESFIAGPNHPAIGELTAGELYYRRIAEQLTRCDQIPQNCLIEVPVGEISKAVGQKKRNVKKLKENYPIHNIKFVENRSLTRYNIVLAFEADSRKFK